MEEFDLEKARMELAEVPMRGPSHGFDTAAAAVRWTFGYAEASLAEISRLRSLDEERTRQVGSLQRFSETMTRIADASSDREQQARVELGVEALKNKELEDEISRLREELKKREWVYGVALWGVDSTPPEVTP